MTTPRDDIDGLIERLRAFEVNPLARSGVTDLINEAATQLDALSAETAELQAALDRVVRVDNSLAKQLSKSIATNAALSARERESFQKYVDANEARIEAERERDALSARVKELEWERDKWDRRVAYDELKAREYENRATQQRQIDDLTIRAEAAEARATRLQQERDEAYERAVKECSDYARWAEQQISEDDPAESSKSQLFATISNAADDCAEKVRDIVRQLATGNEKEKKV